MMTESALIISLLANIVAVWYYLHSKSKNKNHSNVCHKARKLRTLEKNVTNLSKGMKD